MPNCSPCPPMPARQLPHSLLNHSRAQQTFWKDPEGKCFWLYRLDGGLRHSHWILFSVAQKQSQAICK